MTYPAGSSWNDPPTAAQIASMNKALRILRRPEVTEANRPETRELARNAMKELWDEVNDRPRVKAALIKNNLENKQMENKKDVQILQCNCCIDKGAKDMIRTILTDDFKRLRKEGGPKESIEYIEALTEALGKIPDCKD